MSLIKKKHQKVVNLAVFKKNVFFLILSKLKKNVFEITKRFNYNLLVLSAKLSLKIIHKKKIINETFASRAFFVMNVLTCRITIVYTIYCIIHDA